MAGICKHLILIHIYELINCINSKRMKITKIHIKWPPYIYLTFIRICEILIRKSLSFPWKKTLFYVLLKYQKISSRYIKALRSKMDPDRS